MLVNGKQLLHILCIFCTNRRRVTSCQQQIVRPLVALRKHTRVSISKILKAKSEIPEHKNGKNNV